MHAIRSYLQQFTERKRSKKKEKRPTTAFFFSSNDNDNDHLKSGQPWSQQLGALCQMGLHCKARLQGWQIQDYQERVAVRRISRAIGGGIIECATKKNP